MLSKINDSPADMGPPPPPARHRQASLSESRSAPDLASLDQAVGHSPAITVDSGTPISPAEADAGLPSPPSSRDGNPRLSSDGYADGEQEEGDEDEDFADFLFGSDGEDMDDDSSSASSSASSTASSRRSSSGTSPPTALASTARRSQSTTGTASTTATLLGRSQSHAQLTSFAPPFYNRPPLPLPPSPSLTSLLRPSFSATPSRPTTPDDSENDTLNDTEAGVAKAASTATTVPRAAPKVPTYEYYGFVLYLTSSAGLVMYVLWSFLPNPFLHALGIDYYPDRWWSLAIPAQLVASLCYVYVALACYNTEVLTLPLTHPGCFVDEAAQVAVLDARGKIIREAQQRKGVELGEKDGKKMKEEKDRSKGAGGSTGKKKHREKKERDRKEKEKHDQEKKANPRHGTIEHHRPEKGDVVWDWRALWSEGTDAVMDVPIGGVCEILYGQ